MITTENKTTYLTPDKEASTSCYHCGESCEMNPVVFEDKFFCCEGCRMVYEILNENDLCKYYQIDDNAGISLKGKQQERYAYLDDPDVLQKLADFTDGKTTRIRFHLPQMHCASCIWLLEQLYRLNEGVLNSKVNFLRKEVHISYSEEETSLRKIVELLASIGYPPAINLSNLEDDHKRVVEKSYYYKLGVAGFCFGNIMLLSFPEYLGLDKVSERFFFQLFAYLNIILAIPAVFYSGIDYIRSAYLGLKQYKLTIDVPIALGILTLFFRSTYEIISHTGAGYLDSLAGLIFFLLIGKWFQQRTYHNISFERDYKSYFPIATWKRAGQKEVSVTLDKLSVGDHIFVRNGEIIPADGVLISSESQIDYSFVTGEARSVKVHSGEKIFAGGRQLGETAEIALTKRVSQSYLTQLWNEDAFSKNTAQEASLLADKVGRYFTIVILLIAFSTLFYWLTVDKSIAFQAFTAVLIIACPCAVALSIPFTFGNVLRILAKNKFYIKNTNVIEAIQKVNAIVFDKTGTLTTNQKEKMEYHGKPLNEEELLGLGLLVRQSNHPVSKQIHAYLFKKFPMLSELNNLEVEGFKETIGKGIEGRIGVQGVKVGSFEFVGADLEKGRKPMSVYICINGEIKGGFSIVHYYRNGLEKLMHYFKQLGRTYLLSGDNDREKAALSSLFTSDSDLQFNQSPQDKLHFISNLQDAKKQVMTIGDGLNDAGALKQSDVGIVITENTNNFTPACDAILDARRFAYLPKFIDFARKSVKLVYYAYGLAFIYNVIGLSFAVQGLLSPVIAAILMPASSITIVLFGVLSSNLLAMKKGIYRDLDGSF